MHLIIESTMRFFILLFLISISNAETPNQILNRLRNELVRSKNIQIDPILPLVCEILASPDFIKNSEDDEFLSSILYELGFGALGIKPDSWAARFRAAPRETASCFSALHSAAVSETTKMPLADSRKIIRRCCIADADADL